MPKYLVVGGAGFIGSNLVRRLCDMRESVAVFDNLSTGKKSNLAGLAGGITFIKGDIRDQQAIARAMRTIEYVFHEAALTSVPQSIDDPALVAEVNIQGTINVLSAARDAGVQRVIFASSSAVYGNHSREAARESMPPRPISPYGISKLAGEHYCRVFSELHGLPTVCLRYFNVFGPRQDFNSGYAAVIPTLITQLLNKKAPTIHGDGRQRRDFTYVSNVVEANLKAAQSSLTNGEGVNIGGGEKVTINELARQLQMILGTNLKPRHKPPRPGDIKSSYADISRAQQLLDYQPAISFAEGLILTAKWYKETV